MGTARRRNAYQMFVLIATRSIFPFSRFYRGRLLRLHLNRFRSRGRSRIFDGHGFLSGLLRILVHGSCPAEYRNIPDNDILEDTLIHFHLPLRHACSNLGLTISFFASSLKPLFSNCLGGGGSRVQRRKSHFVCVTSFS